MSSILTALKKLEKNDFHKEAAHVLSGKTHFRHNNYFMSLSGNSLVFNFLFFTLLIILVLVSGTLAWNYFERKKNGPLVENQKMAPVSNALMESKTPEKTTESIFVEKNANINNESSDLNIKVPNPAVSKSIEIHPQKSSDTIAKIFTPEIPKDTPALEVPGQSAHEPQIPRRTASDSSMQLEIENTTPPSGYENLTLQAIAWAREPVNRMAVINGEIVRQGDTYNGTFINQINENDVVLKKDAYIWRLMFTVR